jgi:hypothetical protein
MTGTSKNSKFVEEGFAEADQMEIDRLKANEAVSKIISSSLAKIDEINVGGAKIRFKSFLDRKLRHRLNQAQKLDDSNVEETEKVMYDALASLCVDDPFNKPSTWRFIEDAGGDVGSILKQMMEIITKSATEAKDFRKKS